MLSKYKGWSDLARWAEYARLKEDWYRTHDYDEKAYDAFIDRITSDLGI